MKLLRRRHLLALSPWPLALVIAFFLLPLSFFLLPPKAALAVTGSSGIKVNPYWRKDTTAVVKDVEAGPENEVNAPRFTFTSVNNTFSAVGAGILDPTGQNRRAAVPMLGSTIALLAGNPPVQTHQYLAYMAGKAGFIDPAFAAERGGFDVLSPIQKIWIATRNIAYLITSLTLVIIGFMIMLRKKIDAQTVIGVQQALPKLVVTLLLITFSYAIAGFVIDMIYFLIFFGIKLLALPGSSIFAAGDGGITAIQTIRNTSIFRIGLGAILGVGGGEEGGITAVAADAVGSLTDDLMGAATGSQTIGSISGLVAAPIGFVVFAVAILFAIFKLFFSLLMAYIQIIIAAIIGPLQLMLNALPGSDAFGKWFRNLLANALAFPAAVFMLVFAAALTGQTGETWKIAPRIGFTSQDAGVKWIPPLLYGQGGGGSNTNSVQSVMALFGIGILLMTPKVVDMVKEWVQAPEFKYGSAIGEALGFGWKGAQAGYGLGRWPGRTMGAELENRDQWARQYVAQHGGDMDTARNMYDTSFRGGKTPGKARWEVYGEALRKKLRGI